MHGADVGIFPCLPTRAVSGTPGRIASASLGFVLIFSAPFKDGMFKDWLIPLFGSYRMNLFEGLAIPIVYLTMIFYLIRIKKYEQFIFLSIAMIIFSRILSLLGARDLMLEQVVSILRYVEALVVIYVCATLFADPRNRSSFLWGVIGGVSVETIGGIVVFLVGRGQVQGVFIGINSFMLQVFLVVALLLNLMDRQGDVVMPLCITALFIGICVSLIRSAFILLILAFAIVTMYAGRRVVRPILVTGSVIVIVIASLWASPIFGAASKSVTGRIKAAVAAEGGVGYRFYLWDMALGSFLENPVTGIGSGGFGRQQESLPRFFDVDIPGEYSHISQQVGTHSTILGVAAETGSAGLIAYLFWFVAVIGMCISVLRSRTRNADNYIIAGSIVVVALTVSDIWGQSSFTPISNTLIGLVMGWRRETSKPWAKPWA